MGVSNIHVYYRFSVCMAVSHHLWIHWIISGRWIAYRRFVLKLLLQTNAFWIDLCGDHFMQNMLKIFLKYGLRSTLNCLMLKLNDVVCSSCFSLEMSRSKDVLSFVPFWNLISVSVLSKLHQEK